MQKHWGWGAADPLCSDAARGHWQGQWESHDWGESSGWGASSWDQLGNDENSRYDEFQNVMRWDDSGALDAFEAARKLSEESSKGLAYSVSLPSPDLYIQAIDWDIHEDLQLPDPGGATSPPRKGQRKRGRRASGGFRRQFDREETSQVSNWKQSSKPLPQMSLHSEVKPEREQEHRGVPMPRGSLDSRPRAGSPSELQVPIQDQNRSNWSTQWSSPHRKQSSNWHGYGRSQWDRQQNLQSQATQQGWRPANLQSGQARGWGRGGGPYWSSHGSSNEPHFQATPIARDGNDWTRRQDTNVQSFTQPPELFHFSSGSRQQHTPGYIPERTRRWRPQQQHQPNQRWQ